MNEVDMDALALDMALLNRQAKEYVLAVNAYTTTGANEEMRLRKALRT